MTKPLNVSTENKYLTLINVFTVDPANQQKLIDLLTKATETTVSQVKGFVSSALHRSLDGKKVTMYAQWESLTDYQAMRSNPTASPYLVQAMEIAAFDPGMYEVVKTFHQDSPIFYHGTKASLKPGHLIEAGFHSNYGKRKKASYVYFTATLDAAVWGAELAQGEEAGRIYIVEPTGAFEDDPNLTDKKFPGNPTKSYRTKHAIRVTGEVADWQGHSPEVLKTMKDHLELLKEQGIEAIED